MRSMVGFTLPSPSSGGEVLAPSTGGATPALSGGGVLGPSAGGGPQIPAPTTPLFGLNLYNAILDLSKKKDRQLFNDACKPLKEELRCDGTKEGFATFLKHFVAELDLKCKEIYQLATE